MSSKNIFAPALLCGLSALFLLGSVRMWQFDASAHRCCDNGAQRHAEHRSSANRGDHRLGCKRREECRSGVERFGWRHIDQPNHDVGYIQYPSVGACCADGNRDGDLDHRFDEIGYVAVEVDRLPAVTMTSIAAATAGTAYNAALTASGGTSPYRGVSTRQRYPRD